MKKKKIAVVLTTTIALILVPFAAYGATTLYKAEEVSYDNTSSGSVSSTVEEALDELYEKANNYVGDSKCNAVAEPNLGTGLVAVTISDDGTVKAADTSSTWYNYCNKEWANAVLLNSSTTYSAGTTIPESDIKAYFVWIPKYKYKLWNVGTSTTLTTVHTIDIVFDTTNTTDVEGESCATPKTSGSSGNCNNGEYMTHPAFLTIAANGFWVGKFETTGTISAMTVKPGVSSLRSQTVYSFFTNMYNYSRTNNSHMMKNTEWGAVAYLSHSAYGINKEVNINNNSAYTTGQSSLLTLQQGTYPGTYGTGTSYNLAYNTTLGYLASTTGNISGIYDMSGGAHEYMAAYMTGTMGSSGFSTTTIANYDSKYFDVYNTSSYTSYTNRILGDATGEMGPFVSFKDGDANARQHNSWYFDYSDFVDLSDPWFFRGGDCYSGVLAGQFYFGRLAGGADVFISARLVLTP